MGGIRSRRISRAPIRLVRYGPAGLAHLTAASADARLGDLRAVRSFRRPWLGAHAERLVDGRGYEQLGFRSLDDYARERLGVSGRTVREWARVARVLRELPLLRAAVQAGDVSWTAAGEIAGLATRAGDQECLDAVRGRTLRAIRSIVRAVDADERSGADGAQDEAYELLRLTTSRELRSHWRAAVELAQRMAGRRLASWEVAEAVAAEAVATVGAPPSGDDGRRPVRPRDEADGRQAKRWPGLRWRAGAGRARPLDPEAMDRLLAGASPKALDASMRQVLRQGQQADFEVGRVLCRVLGRRLYRELGFATFEEYVSERLDLSPRTARRLVRIARSEAGHAEVAKAFRDGRVNALQAEILLRGDGLEVADACRFTLRRLEEEAPSPLAFSAPRMVARTFRALVARLGLDTLLGHALATWLEAGRLVRDHADFARDGWRCTVPGCSARSNLQSHHLVYRSRGGPDVAWNRTTLCAFHHLRGVHAGWLQIRGKAPDRLVYRLGFGVFASGDRRLSA